MPARVQALAEAIGAKTSGEPESGGSRGGQREKAVEHGGPVGNSRESGHAPVPAMQTLRTESPHAAAPSSASTAGDRVERAHLAQQLAGHIEAMRSAPAGRSEMSVSLTPDHLGGLRLTVASDGTGVAARIVVETAQAHQAINSAKSELRAALESRGINLTSLDVSLSQGGGGAHFGQRQPMPDELNGRIVWTPTLAAVPADPPIAAPAVAIALFTRERLDYRA